MDKEMEEARREADIVIGSLPKGTKILGVRTFAGGIVFATSIGVYTLQNDKLEKVVPRLKGGGLADFCGDLL
jgi:hypothetical protein